MAKLGAEFTGGMRRFLEKFGELKPIVADPETQLAGIQAFLQGMAATAEMGDDQRRQQLALLADKHLSIIPGIDGFDFGEVDVVFGEPDGTQPVNLATLNWLAQYTSELVEKAGGDPNDYFLIPPSET